jgi:ABC-2 type transport system ATP-binding protein
MNAIEIAHLSHRFGPTRALDDVTFAVEPGGFAVLLGLNGAGKTTLISLLTRLYQARLGEIRVFGRSLRQDAPGALARMGIVFQQPTLDLDLSVAENLSYYAALHGLSRRVAAARGAEELKRLGVAERLHDRVRALSGGQRRRVELARALLHQPQLLVLDEPTVGLDLQARSAIMAHVRQLCRNRGTSVLWTTHLLDEVAADDKLIVLHRGRVLAHCDARELCRRAGKEELGAAFLHLTEAA